MAVILVSGLINIETTLRVERFPIEYSPVRYPFGGARSTASGVGANVALALAVLGDEPRLLSLTGDDLNGRLAAAALRERGLDTQRVLPRLAATPQSVILYDGEGRRQINVDLKDIQEAEYPAGVFEDALRGCDIAALCNVNFSRPLLARARAAGKPAAVDVHALGDLHDPYNADFMRHANILFLSHENAPGAEDFARQLAAEYGNEVIVMGLGGEGALLHLPRAGVMERMPAVHTRPVVNTIGAGDALFSAFLHFYAQGGDARQALRRAMVFASHKIGETGAAEGFLSEAELQALYGNLLED